MYNLAFSFLMEFFKHSASLSYGYIMDLVFGVKKIAINRRLDGNDGNNTLWDGYERVKVTQHPYYGTLVDYYGKYDFNSLIYGNGGNDLIQALDGHDVVYGGSGNDTIEAGTGNDYVSGDDGNDLIKLGDGNDWAQGGNGNDVIYGDKGNDIISGGAGGDQIDGGLGDDSVSYADSDAAVIINLNTNIHSGGHATGDTLLNIENIIGSSFNDNLTGNSANNVISGGNGADIIDGGDGNDTVSYSDSDAGVTVNLDTNINSGGHANGDLLINIENILGSEFDDNLTGNASNNIINGGNGSDIINGGAGADKIDGGSGSDAASYKGSNAAVTVNLKTNIHSGGYAGGDNLINIENIIGSSFNDNLIGNSSNNIFNGGAGADRIDGISGNDTASYSDSDASVNINLNSNIFSGGYANGDTLFNIDNITGSNFNDILTGSSASNIIIGGDGADIIDGGKGNDVMDGGNGLDIYSFFSGSGSDTINDSDGVITIDNTALSGLAQQVGTSNKYLLGNYQLQLSSGNLAIKHHKSDVVTIKSFQDNEFGIELNNNPTASLTKTSIKENKTAIIDVLEMAADLDGDLLSIASITNSNKGQVSIINDLDGNQKISYTPNQNWNGTDKFNYTITDGKGGSVTKTISVVVSAVNNTISGGNNNDILNGNAKNDLILGNNGNDTIDGNGGNDELRGGAGNDNIQGDSGNDDIYGDSGNDYLVGGTGDDFISGGLGQDTLVGGAGKDTFIYQFFNESSATINTMDLIQDFKKGEDVINLQDLDLLDHIITFDSNPNDDNITEGLSYHFDNANNTIIEYHDDNPDNNFAIKLTGRINLGEGDFEFFS